MEGMFLRSDPPLPDGAGGALPVGRIVRTSHAGGWLSLTSVKPGGCRAEDPLFRALGEGGEFGDVG